MWISVEDRLPEPGSYDNWKSHVLLLAGDRVLEGYLWGNGNWARANAAHTKDLPPITHWITHWMPIPAPPGKATNADTIRAMSNAELAVTLMCPNEMGLAEIDCGRGDECNCCRCLLGWLGESAREVPTNDA